MKPRFTPEEVNRAYDEWGCNCGPSALAAITGLTLDEVRPHIKGFDEKHYTNPTMMREAVGSILKRPVKWSHSRYGFISWPMYGLVRIQWEGPWTAPGVPMKARYRYTHWIGVESYDLTDVGIFDINAMANGTGWCFQKDWSGVIVPFILSHVPRSNGKWHITHAIEVERG